MTIHDIAVSGYVYQIVEAAEMLEQIRPLSVSQLQRRLGIGYGRAARILDLFAELEIVSLPTPIKGACTPLVSSREALLRVLQYLQEVLTAEPVNENDECAAEVQDLFGQDSEDADAEKPILQILKSDADGEGIPWIDWSDPDFTEEPAPEPPAAPVADLSPAERLRRAVEIACERERIGTSVLQRTLNLGYGRAAKLIDQMESLGIVGPDPGNKTGRPVLLTLEEALARLPAEED